MRATDEAPPDRPVALLFATSGHSGVDRVIRNLLEAFADVPRSFHLLTIHGHGPYPDTLPDNVTHRPLPARHRNTVVPALMHYLWRERPAALLTASHRLNRAALLARALTRARTRVAIRMGMTLSGQEADLGAAKAHRLWRSMRRWYPRADAVIAPSPGVGDDLQRLAGVRDDQLRVIPNPLIDDRLRAQAAAEPSEADPAVEWLGEPGRPPAAPVILGAGSLEPRKDFATLIDAFARLRARHGEARLVILGEGRQRAALQGQVERLGLSASVRLPGFTDNPYAWMARASVFALTSQREGSGAVLVEALACGIPVVATDCPTGPATTLQGGQAGELVPIGDAEGLARALERALTSPPSAEARHAATRPFQVATAAQGYLRALGIQARGVAG